MAEEKAIMSELYSEFNKPSADLKKLGALIQRCLSLDKVFADARTYQDVLEMGCLWAAHSRVSLPFERYYQMLSSVHYFAAGARFDEIPGDRKWLLTGLQLLNLLISGRISEFHILLEQLPESSLLANPFILFPLKIEQSLIEGTYLRIPQYKRDAPSAEYSWLIDGLLDTIRNEVISCVESSTASIRIGDLRALLLLESLDDQLLKSLAKQRGWTIADESIVFNLAKQDSREFDASTQILHVLQYARHIEQII